MVELLREAVRRKNVRGRALSWGGWAGVWRCARVRWERVGAGLGHRQVPWRKKRFPRRRRWAWRQLLW